MTKGARVLGALYRFALRNDTYLVGGVLVMVVAVTSIASGMQGRFFMDGHHPGNMMNGALNVLHGQPLLSEVQSIYGLLLPYLNALQLYVFGETYLSLWVLPVVAFAGGLVIYHKLFRTFLDPLESLIAVFILLALNSTVLMPWSNYVVFGINALVLVLFCQAINGAYRYRPVLFGIGALIFFAALIRPQDVLLLPVLLATLFLYSNKDHLAKAVALSSGFVLPLAMFVLWLAFQGTLKDYYLQTVAIQDRLYFADKGPFSGLREVFEVFTTGFAAEKPHLQIGFAPFGNLFGILWLLVFLPSAFVVIRVGVLALSGTASRGRIPQQLPLGVVLLAMLTAMGPLFALHNVWDNFRYALHMAQGIGVIFYCVDQLPRKAVARVVIVMMALFFSAPLYALSKSVTTSITYLTSRTGAVAQASQVKYFENIEFPDAMRARLLFVEQFFRNYSPKYPDSYVYTSLWSITDGIYAIGKIPNFHKTLTNDHFASTYARYYPEYPGTFVAAAQSRKLIYVTFDGAYSGLAAYDYVKFREVSGVSIFIARERAETFNLP
ncbi:hypothetical protein LPW26_19690 [Rhodopseudomonas sp. HC1]|uniref:hypothetical protein n=1 Tax=Rhodopseudomonas infernalis TaxID=2897386 RepID=UPI001EE9A764|nr:hypothetical protein [Rhodopseudomonas infernalis]MCG6206873.1 hypothetical protein [Rhodopseudomonas infernalis]